MTLIERLRADQLAARKAREGIKSSLLTTLIGEAAMIGKNNGNRESTDSEVQAVIKKFVKNLDETIQRLFDAGFEGGQIMISQAEKDILLSYLPKQMTEDELRDVVTGLKSELGVLDVKGKGLIMKTLKERFDGQYDGKMAALVVDAALRG